ncbi:MAG: bifunctional diaminohydroxyphosphoribosylaminopyrimidine deaminase/5-amino-6-(5-phosphoribosylamino)uracil reductase RibD [Flavipsychrobacter sp.]|nr:bifunctional diaminohydroxyphosphoribosylaminopyrimidine deaminase/5-amino-6-(5-phosphoribosylamino)uracil reductase RibD [Flavipsychrobacter sp.]
MMMHEQYIRRCLELAQLGKGYVSPNPMVGAVLVHNGRIIGEGWHKEYGKAHAEVNCIESVADIDKQLIPESMMYVSLEPCAHHGKTPPCAERLVKERVKEVIVCNPDPFEKVGGRGMQILHDNNIATTTGILDKEGRWLNRRFFCVQEHKRPYIILKWARSANGIFAPYGNRRYQISNVYSSSIVHKWRTEEDAIIVGTNTALADDPQLTSRLWEGKNPLRIVIDRSLILPTNLKLFKRETDTWVVNDKKDEQGDNLQYIKLEFDEHLLENILQRLYDAKVQSLIVEGGAKLLHTFIAKGLWDEARVIIGDKVIEHGIAAPVLTNTAEAFETSLAEDMLHVYVNSDSKYPYAEGMGL